MKTKKALAARKPDGNKMPIADSPEKIARHDLRNKLGVVMGNISLLKRFVQNSGTDNDRRALSLLEKNATEMKGLIDGAYVDKPTSDPFEPRASKKQEKILIVDDEQDFVDTAIRMLEHEGYEMGFANSGARGLKMAKDYNLMLLDLRMPNMSGNEVLKRMKKAGMKVPVIVMTGLEMPVTMREEIEETHPGTKVMFKSELGRLAEQVKNTLGRDMQNAKIMMVDDDRDFSQTISALLGEKGYTTVCANSPEECLLKAKEEKPDVVLLDIMMPGSSLRAKDVVDGLRLMEGLEKTPVIYLSGVKATDRQKKELVESGFVSGFIEKPVNESELLRSIREVLKGRKDRP